VSGPAAFVRWDGKKAILVPANKGGQRRELTEAEALKALGKDLVVEMKADPDTWLSLYRKEPDTSPSPQPSPDQGRGRERTRGGEGEGAS